MLGISLRWGLDKLGETSLKNFAKLLVKDNWVLYNFFIKTTFFCKNFEFLFCVNILTKKVVFCNLYFRYERICLKYKNGSIKKCRVLRDKWNEPQVLEKTLEFF